MHIDNKGKYISILDKGTTQGLDGTTFKAGALYPINFIQSGKRSVLSLHYNGSNSFLFVNATNAYQFKAKNSETKDYALCLGNFSKVFTINNMKRSRIKKSYNFVVVVVVVVDFNFIDTSNVIDIDKNLVERT